MKLPINTRFKVNKVIQFLTLSDLLLFSALGLITPFLPLFIVENLPGGSITIAGFATTILLFTRSVMQIPIGHLLDKHKGEIDDYWALLIGSLLVSFSLFGLTITQTIWQLFLFQFIQGIATALTFPAWYAIFSRHLDRNKEGIEWSFYNTTVDLGSALTASIGGAMILTLGYQIVFLLTGFLCLFGGIFIYLIRDSLKRK